MKKLILSVVLCVLCASVQSETYKIDLQQSIEIAKTKSLNMQIMVQSLKIAEYNLKSATSRLKTHIDLNFVSPSYSNSVEELKTDSTFSYFSLKRLNYGGNLEITQPLPTSGSVYVKTGASNTDLYTYNIRRPELFTRIGVEQPLTALYGYNEIKAALKKAELQYEGSKKGLKREELNLIYQVSQSFYNLLSAQKSTEIAKLDYDRQNEAYSISQNKYKAGLIKEVDALQMEVDLAEAQNNYDLAVVNMNSNINTFKEIIGVGQNDSISLSSEFKYNVVIVDPEKAVQMAIENRLEIREQEIEIELNKLNVKNEKSQGMIQSSLNMYYEKYGTSQQSISNSLSSSLKESYSDYQKRSPNYGIGLTVKVPILDFGERKAKVKAAQSRQKQVEIQKELVERSIIREVRNLVGDLNSSLKRLQLLEKNIVVAEKSFEITRQRYSDGDIDSQNLALERKRLNTAYTSHLSAYINYQLLLADIMRKTFYDFQKNELIR